MDALRAERARFEEEAQQIGKLEQVAPGEHAVDMDLWVVRSEQRSGDQDVEEAAPHRLDPFGALEQLALDLGIGTVQGDVQLR